MAEFCECGSLVIDGRCSNKGCSLRAALKPAPAKKASTRPKASGVATAEIKPVVKKQSSRRASKCITYNLNDLKDRQPES